MMKRMSKVSACATLAMILIGTLAQAQSVPEGFSYQAIVLGKSSQKPLLETVSLTVQVLSPDKTCLLYEEQHNRVDLAKSQGIFAVKVGTPLKSSQRTSRDPGLSMHKLLSNEAKVVVAARKANCTSGYTAKSGDARVIRTYVTHGNSHYELQDQIIGAVPYATVAESLQGQTLIDLDNRYTIKGTEPAGPKGDKGDKGDAGAPGVIGEKGEKGSPGIAGPAGPQGAAGAIGAAGSIGPAGAAGAKGDKGDKGDKGASGDKGPQGVAGPAGPQGSAGAKGANGANGAAGIAGAAGSSVLSGIANPTAAVGNNGDTYVNLTSGAVFQKRNGAWAVVAGVTLKGPKGDVGEIKLPACKNTELLTVAAGAVKCIARNSIVPTCAEGQTLTMKSSVWTCTNVATVLTNVLKTVKPVTVAKCLSSNNLETVVATCPAGHSLFSCSGSSGDLDESDEGYRIDSNYVARTCTLKVKGARCGDSRNGAGPGDVQNQIVTALCFPG